MQLLHCVRVALSSLRTESVSLRSRVAQRLRPLSQCQVLLREHRFARSTWSVHHSLRSLRRSKTLPVCPISTFCSCSIPLLSALSADLPHCYRFLCFGPACWALSCLALSFARSAHSVLRIHVDPCLCPPFDVSVYLRHRFALSPRRFRFALHYVSVILRLCNTESTSSRVCVSLSPSRPESASYIVCVACFLNSTASASYRVRVA